MAKWQLAVLALVQWVASTLNLLVILLLILKQQLRKITDGKTVEFSGGKNLTVKQTSDENGAKVEYALSNNVNLTNEGSLTVGDTKITDGGLVINNGPS